MYRLYLVKVPFIDHEHACLNVVDNGAMVGGVITHGTFFGVDVSGQRAITAVIDNGTSANDPADQISYSIFPQWTGGFPPDDPSFCLTRLPSDNPFLSDLARGQVKVW